MIKNNFRFQFILFVLFFVPLMGCSNPFEVATNLNSVDNPVIPPIDENPVTTVPDTFFGYAWHLNNTRQRVFASESPVAGNDLNLQSTWAQNILGQGILIRVSDDGIDDAHPDLTANFNYNNLSRRYNLNSPYISQTARPTLADDNHGTSVAGIIAARYNNGVGAAGVAPMAQITSANFLSASTGQTMAQLVDQASGDFDILNMSWGYVQNTLQPPYEPLIDQFKHNVENGRSGKGSLMIKAAGNDFFILCNGSNTVHCTGNANMDGDNSSPYTLLITALASNAQSASYSSTGSNTWVSAFGGETGEDSPAIFTTDRTGCSLGYAKSSAQGNINFERGSSGNTNCNYTAVFSGTSAAAPMASGVVALLMQANPDLTWRDIKYILAKTATQVHSNFLTVTTHPLQSYFGTTLPSGYSWEIPWVTNGANFKFHNWYGFGRINVDAAITMAQSYDENFGPLTTTNWTHTRTGLSQAIPDNSSTGVINTINVTQDLTIEAVQIKLRVTHADISELAIELTSPSGTKSILMNMQNSLTGISNYQGDEVLLSNAFYHEGTLGNWTIRVLDGKSTRTGTLTSWSLNFFGH